MSFLIGIIAQRSYRHLKDTVIYDKRLPPVIY
jgi:hypothetical protein